MKRDEHSWSRVYGVVALARVALVASKASSIATIQEKSLRLGLLATARMTQVMLLSVAPIITLCPQKQRTITNKNNGTTRLLCYTPFFFSMNWTSKSTSLHWTTGLSTKPGSPVPLPSKTWGFQHGGRQPKLYPYPQALTLGFVQQIWIHCPPSKYLPYRLL